MGICGNVWGHVAGGGGVSQGLGRAYCRGIHQMSCGRVWGHVAGCGLMW